MKPTSSKVNPSDKIADRPPHHLATLEQSFPDLREIIKANFGERLERVLSVEEFSLQENYNSFFVDSIKKWAEEMV